MEIDSRMQEASLRGLESVLSHRQLDVTYARQEAERATRLLAAGAASQMEADRATNNLQAAEAQLRTVEEQLRTSRTDIDYYRVTAPTAGVVGDIPVREGDRVTKSTLLTTIDAKAGFEVYINVPVQQASKLKQGLTVRLVAERPHGRRRISFISSVDTQTHRARQDARDTAGNLRTDQYLRAQVIFSAEPGLSILTSVTSQRSVVPSLPSLGKG
jgi:multidrug efflux pump subunit AcrA (membrane-fusion protein)